MILNIIIVSIIFWISINAIQLQKYKGYYLFMMINVILCYQSMDLIVCFLILWIIEFIDFIII